jgi:hypothetical protein
MFGETKMDIMLYTWWLWVGFLYHFMLGIYALFITICYPSRRILLKSD